MERKNDGRRNSRFNTQSSATVTCSGCGGTIRPPRTFAVVVCWYEKFVSNETGEDVPVSYGDLKTTALLYTDPLPRPVILIEPKSLGLRLKEEPIITIHHLNNCGVVTNRRLRRAHGSAYSGKRQ